MMKEITSRFEDELKRLQQEHQKRLNHIERLNFFGQLVIISLALIFIFWPLIEHWLKGATE